MSRDTIPDTPVKLPHARPEDNPGRVNQDRTVRTQPSGLRNTDRNNPAVKGGKGR
jgi:hypothetical protein